MPNKRKKASLFQILLDALVENVSAKSAAKTKLENQNYLSGSRLKSASSVDSLLALTPSEFEETIAAILRERGASAQVSGGSGDLTADITGTTKDGVPFIAQCKRYAVGHPVGSVEMQQFIGMGYVHHKVSSLAYFTTSSFTSPAKDLARTHGVSLFDGAAIVQLAVETVKATNASRLPPPGWYSDPAKTSSKRYWDGSTWTGRVRP